MRTYEFNAADVSIVAGLRPAPDHTLWLGDGRTVVRVVPEAPPAIDLRNEPCVIDAAVRGRGSRRTTRAAARVAYVEVSPDVRGGELEVTDGSGVTVGTLVAGQGARLRACDVETFVVEGHTADCDSVFLGAIEPRREEDGRQAANVRVVGEPGHDC